ncbi:polysaccharide biosynthesis protein [Fictibacillus fluitans]|uniref:Nucleoside-diphosphate sugar epimerase/dehydratase n=1 Tax=Fictibacillus fluitans TaxID=3058422 RepID=A0ABT8I120_9BACL|nr:nucleoside-diphosphate sugar epimerase/dehydratase [Fictibacillus sp. NE201]MDN4526736.1 nucleoside-diphosphate sugar epimerase/dehydratase [Fictibacillus sp. NE201]
MTYRQRLTLFLAIDSVIVLTAIFFSRFLVSADIHVLTPPIVLSSLVILISHHLFSIKFKLYKKAWEYASIGELIVILKVVTISILCAGVIQEVLLEDIYFRLLVVTWLIHVLSICGSRFCWRMFRDTYLLKATDKKKTLIVGAGSAGTMIVRQLLKNSNSKLQPVGFIDDDPKKQYLDIMGIPVIGGLGQIQQAVKEYEIENIVIAIPSLRKKELNTIAHACTKTNVKTQIIPMLEDLMTGKVSINEFRDVKVEDLLGREPVHLDIDSISEYVTGKTVLVTGAGGSIGSEVCRQISKFSPGKLILLGHGENSIYSIEMELRESFGHSSIEFITEIADLQDQQKILTVVGKHRPHVIYHAAAHKHVPLMERNPEEAVKNNLMGTRNIAEAANWHGVETFVMISTDKAVNPTSVMGATKRLAEMVIQDLNTKSKTKFVAVRFGNVLGSRGSVIPLFKKQIEKGGPVTVTHPEMIRYFMTIPEASRLVIQAGAVAQGGEIFVLDMGDPVKIVDLARNLITLSGHSIEDIGIEFSGIRPGEKLFEELLKPDEVHDQQVFPKIYVGKTTPGVYRSEIDELIVQTSLLDANTLRAKLLYYTNEYQAQEQLVTVPS